MKLGDGPNDRFDLVQQYLQFFNANDTAGIAAAQATTVFDAIKQTFNPRTQVRPELVTLQRLIDDDATIHARFSYTLPQQSSTNTHRITIKPCSP